MKTLKNSIRIVLIILCIGLIGYGGYRLTTAGYSRYLQTPVDESDPTRYVFKVKSGENVKSIGERLEQEGLISTKYIFYFYVRFKNLGEKIQAGQYVLQKTQKIPEIAEVLTKSQYGEEALVVPEGWTVRDIDNALTEMNLIKQGEFSDCTKICNFDDYSFVRNVPSLEGYLFPDTYFIDPKTFTVESMIRRMLDNFTIKMGDLLYYQGEEKSSLHQKIIMASIIEKEVRSDKDRKLVSGILWKRLASGWNLGADATIIYITGRNTITAADLEVDSPYNTRKNIGLPPTPISNPGLKSIQAAFFPEANEYWFYLTTPDTGEVIYSITNEEHNKNKQKYYGL